MTSNTTKQGLIERLEALQHPMKVDVYNHAIDECIELISNHPEPEVSEEVVEAVARAIYESDKSMTSIDYIDEEPVQTDLRHAKAAIAAYRKATGAV